MSDPINSILQFLDKNFLLIVLGVGGLALGMFIYRKFIEEEKYKQKDLSERVEESLKDVILTLGTNLDAYVRYRLSILGKFRKGYHFEITEKGKEEGEFESWESFVVRPEFKVYNPFPFILWGILDFIAGLGWFEDTYLVPSKFVHRKDQIEISKKVDFHKIGGVYVIKNERGLKAIRGETILSLFEDSMEKFSNLVDLINFLDMKFSQNIQDMEKEYELEGKRWGAREKGAVEGG